MLEVELREVDGGFAPQVDSVISVIRPARGFAKMDPDKQREIAKKGGVAAHRSGNAHKFTSDEARAAGKKGGKAVSANRAHMAEIGRRGGEARRKRAPLS